MDLNVTSVGHYYLNILPQEGMTIQDCYLALPKNPDEHKVIFKLHRQFGHPRKEVLETLLKNVGEESEVTKKTIEKIHQRCMTCKKFSLTPPRPVVSLPEATEFNQVLTMDLKQVKVLNYRYILHMIQIY